MNFCCAGLSPPLLRPKTMCATSVWLETMREKKAKLNGDGGFQCKAEVRGFCFASTAK